MSVSKQGKGRSVAGAYADAMGRRLTRDQIDALDRLDSYCSEQWAAGKPCDPAAIAKALHCFLRDAGLRRPERARRAPHGDPGGVVGLALDAFHSALAWDRALRRGHARAAGRHAFDVARWLAHVRIFAMSRFARELSRRKAANRPRGRAAHEAAAPRHARWYDEALKLRADGRPWKTIYAAIAAREGFNWRSVKRAVEAQRRLHAAAHT